MLTIVAMNEARKPHHWHWLWAGQEAQTTPRIDPSTDNTLPPDTRLRPIQAPRSGPADAIRALPFEDASEPTSSEATTYLSGVDADALQAVEDDRPLRAIERESWFNLWQVLRESDEQVLRSNSLGPVGFVPLFKQPGVYRGKLVDIRGTVHTAYRTKAPPNDLELSEYYVCWIRPDGGSNSPVAAYVLDLPSEFPIGEDVREVVHVTGFFFKRMAYLAQDGSRTAPLLQAKTVRWLRAAPSSPARTESLSATTQYLLFALGIAGTLAVSVILAVSVYWLSVRKRPSRSYTPASRVTPDQIAQLSDLEIMPSTKETLQRLTDSETG